MIIVVLNWTSVEPVPVTESPSVMTVWSESANYECDNNNDFTAKSRLFQGKLNKLKLHRGLTE